PLKGKAAYLPEWQKNPVRLEAVPEGMNVGLLLELAGLTDLDLDSIEAQYTVPAFLDIDTLAVGRGGTIRRYLYEGAAENRTYKDLNGDVLLEVRHLGKQTMWAGSTHPDTGEAIEVMRDVHPLPMPDEEAIYKAATSALIARHLPAGGRHDLAMAYAGFLLRRGLTEDEVFEMLWTAWELNDPSADADKDLSSIIRHTAEKIAQDKPATGGNTLTHLIPGMTDKISEYWGWDQVLTHEEKEEQERQEQVKRAEESWENPKVQRIAKSYDILNTFRSELNAAGIVGVDREVQLLFMAGCSRLLDRPISIAIKGPSSAGKSHVMENALIKPLPDHAVKFFTSMSERALIYSQEDYRHTMIAIAEQSGVNSPFLDYIIRTLLSESRLEYETVEKVNRKHVPRKLVKPGPTGSVISTTQPNLHPENETRILSVWIKDTREQTAQVMRSIAKEAPEKDFTAWKAYGIWLEGQDNRVWIPYAESLSRQIASLHVRQRRDFKLLLNTIKTVAFMHQQRRERDYQGRIIATLRDYEIARELLNDLLSEGIGATVNKTVRETVAAVKALTVDATPKQEHITNKAVAAELDIDPSSASARVKN
ncbi:MAG: hypothetical protein ICV68_18270, partial [Pyrinomonadaceae bacterium]|nr:hypothetical protein [Pyrinomonadaceae bacterium]